MTHKKRIYAYNKINYGRLISAILMLMFSLAFFILYSIEYCAIFLNTTQVDLGYLFTSFIPGMLQAIFTHMLVEDNRLLFALLLGVCPTVLSFLGLLTYKRSFFAILTSLTLVVSFIYWIVINGVSLNGSLNFSSYVTIGLYALVIFSIFNVAKRL